MGKVRKLPEEIVDKIAAGEVVERPASVVKELIENALDADARAISIEVEGGGKRVIRVRDDGMGMSGEDLELAVQPHTTSKILSEDDLYEIKTFGFRGEALASIGAVSILTITSRERGQDSGWKIEVAGGEIKELVPTNAREGTDVIVRTLFYNTPARLRFLKRDSTEEAYVKNVVKYQAMANSSVTFSFTANKKKVLHLPAVSSSLERIRQIFRGEDFAEDLVEMEEGEGELKFHAVYAPPSFTRKRSSYIYTFVNGRYVKNRALDAVIINSFRQIIPPDRFPIFVLFLEVPPRWIDVNVHPSKLEIKFFNERKILNFIGKTIVNKIGDEIGTLPAMDYIKVEEKSADAYKNTFPSQNPLPVSHVSYLENPPEFEDIKILGQAFGTYIIYQKGDELFFMDQHATHEKIIFVHLLNHFKEKSVYHQKLLIPLSLNLSEEEEDLLIKNIVYFESLGFKFEIEGKVKVISHPQVIETGKIESIIKDLLDEIVELDEPLSLEEYIKKLAATIACKSAIKGNTPLSFDKMLYLIKEAEKVKESKYCPHGRPAIFKLTKSQFEKIFLRNEH